MRALPSVPTRARPLATGLLQAPQLLLLLLLLPLTLLLVLAVPAPGLASATAASKKSRQKRRGRRKNKRRAPLLLLLLLLLVLAVPTPGLASATAASKKCKQKRRGRRRNKRRTPWGSVSVVAPCGDEKDVVAAGGCTTTSTKVGFRVTLRDPGHPAVVRFLLNDIEIRSFGGETLRRTQKMVAKDRHTIDMSMDISNLPHGVYHTARFELFASAAKPTVVSNATRKFWLVDAWEGADLDAAGCYGGGGGGDAVCPASPPPPPPAAATRTLPFHANRVGLFTPEETARIRAYASQRDNGFTNAVVGENEHVDTEYRRTETLIVRRNTDDPDTEWFYSRLEAFATRMNRAFWQFDLGAGDAGAGHDRDCRLHESLQILKYRSSDKGFYDRHLDTGISGVTSLRKLSVTVQLSPATGYSGGDLEIMTGMKTLPMPRSEGAAVVFPSYMMHRVTPVTRGDRFAIVMWFTGCTAFS